MQPHAAAAAAVLGSLIALGAVSVTEGSGPALDPGLNVSYLLNNFQIGYDRRVRPNYGGIPVTVGVTLYILSIGDLSEKFMDFTFDMYFRQFWSDPRLSFVSAEFGIEKLVVGAEYIKLIWVPDTFFVNEKIALFHQATTENQFLRITHTGEVLRSMRLTIKATCPMNLANFPFDEQMCTVEIESFGYTMADLRYQWNDGPKSVQMSPDVALPQFLVLGHRQRFLEVSLSSGNYSRLLADVQFIRSMGYYMIQVRSEKVGNVNVEPTLICLLSHLSSYFGPGLVLRHQRRSGAIIYHTLSFCFLILPSPSSLFIKVHITLIPGFKTTVFVFAKIGFQVLKLCHLYMLQVITRKCYLQVYIPSSLIVIMSWVSFWLNRGAAPARVGLGVTTVLTMTTLMASVNAALPKISYMKSIDIYLGEFSHHSFHLRIPITFR